MNAKVPQSQLDQIAFDGVKRHTWWLQYSGRSVAEFVGMLVSQRPFETQVEENLDNAEKALTDALESVRKARAYYKSLPGEEIAAPDKK